MGEFDIEHGGLYGIETAIVAPVDVVIAGVGAVVGKCPDGMRERAVVGCDGACVA